MRRIDRNQLIAEADLDSPRVRFRIMAMTLMAIALLFGSIAFFMFR